MTKENDDRVEVYLAVEPAEDKVYRLAEAAASAIPAAQSMLHALITPPIQKRMEVWIEQTEKKIKSLEKEGRVDLDELESRPEFSALLLRTIQAAAVTSQENQLEALRNFIINISLKPAIKDDEMFIILEVIKDFTPSHIRVLHFYDSPSAYMEEIIKLRRSINMREVTALTGNPQGQELSAVFGNGDPDYGLNIFNIVQGKHLVINHHFTIDPKSPDIYINGKSTDFGKKVISLILEAE